VRQNSLYAMANFLPDAGSPIFTNILPTVLFMLHQTASFPYKKLKKFSGASPSPDPASYETPTLAISQCPRKLWKWDGGRSSRESLGRGLNLSQFWGSGGVTPWNFFWKYRCKSVHFGDIRSSKVGRKIDVFRPTFKSGIYRPCHIGSAAAALPPHPRVKTKVGTYEAS